MLKRLAIVTTHPIQYYAPIFRILQTRKNIEINVFYTLGSRTASEYDPGFGKRLNWDIPLLDGYLRTWANNTAAKPGTRNFKGIITPGLAAAISEWQPDAVLVFGWAYRSHLQVIRHFHKKIPIYFRGDSTLLNEAGFVKDVLRLFFLKWVYRHIAHAFYAGINNKAYFLKCGLKEGQLSFAPHAIDNARFSEERTEEANALRLSLDISPDAIVILFAGKFEPVKEVRLLLSAFIGLENKNTHLLLVGNGVDEPELKEIASASAVAATIHFLDFKNQSYMPVLYQVADLFCLPSKSESWGLSVNEAMACGTAILVSDKVGCAADLVKSGRNGEVFKSGDLNNLSGYLRKLTEDKQLLATFGKQSRIMIADWNFTAIAQAIEKQLLNEAN